MLIFVSTDCAISDPGGVRVMEEETAEEVNEEEEADDAAEEADELVLFGCFGIDDKVSEAIAGRKDENILVLVWVSGFILIW